MGHCNGSPKVVRQSNSICRPCGELNNFVKDWLQDLTPSGGLGKFASKSRIQIHRNVAGKDEVFVFNYSDFLSGKNNILLKPGDLIIVPERGLFN